MDLKNGWFPSSLHLLLLEDPIFRCQPVCLFSGVQQVFFTTHTKSYPNFCLNMAPRLTAKLGWWIIVEHEYLPKTSQKMVGNKKQENIEQSSQNYFIIRVVWEILSTAARDLLCVPPDHFETQGCASS